MSQSGAILDDESRRDAARRRAASSSSGLQDGIFMTLTSIYRGDPNVRVVAFSAPRSRVS